MNKNFKQYGHQGDTQWFQVNSIPTTAKKVEKQFIAASERTGSFHCLFGEYDQYEDENGFYIETKDECILNHSLKEHINGIKMTQKVTLPIKDHRSAVIPAGTKFFVGIHRRADPLTASFKKVID